MRRFAIAAGILGQLEVWVFWVPGEQGPKLLAAVALALMAAALAFSRERPLAALGAICVVYATWALIDVPAGSLMPFVILLVAVFCAAELSELGPALAAGAAGLATIWLEFPLTDNDVANYAFTGVFVVGSWLAGRGLRGRQQRVDHLEDHTVRLEREREAAERAAVAEERTRIARELHDVVAHNVSVIVIQAQAGQAAGATGEVGASLRSIESTGQEALVEMRRLLGLLRSGDEELALAPQPSLEHIERLAETVSAAGLPVEVQVEGEPAPLPPGVDVSAYRIVQEALTNALKHAGPARARVVLRYSPTELELEISDDGTGDAGSENGTRPPGHGLVGVRERAGVYGGVVESGSRPDGGYAVRVRLPLGPVRP
jgi:signal transduction histidine kinase